MIKSTLSKCPLFINKTPFLKNVLLNCTQSQYIPSSRLKYYFSQLQSNISKQRKTSHNFPQNPEQKQKSIQPVTQQDSQVPKRLKQPPRRQNKQLAEFFAKEEQQKLEIIQQLKHRKQIKNLSILAHEMLFYKQSDVVWCALEEAFVSFLGPTQNPEKIRSVSKMLYALGKSKKATRNYETHFALLLPFASHQSFTQIVTTISRMGGMSEEFSHIVQKLYWKRKQQFNPLQLSLINYVLAKNGKNIDLSLIQNLSTYPLRSISMILRSYDLSQSLTPQILKKCIPAIIARKSETNFFDLKDLINLYSKHLYLDDQGLIQYFDQSYKALARNINEEVFEEIWQFFPEAVNANKFPISFVERVIKSLKILKIKNRMSERTWKKIALSFNNFQNLEIRTQLEKI